MSDSSNVLPDHPLISSGELRNVEFSTLDVANPFGAPVYYRETLASTMDEARSLVSGFSGDAPHGTVIAAGYQSAGRGRSGRPWNTERDESLLFTVIFRYPDAAAIPPCFTLRAGLALSLAVEDFIGEAGPDRETLAGRVQVKWPNDIMLIQKDGTGKKAAGVLAEAAGFSGSSDGAVYLGVGINVAQRKFPPELEKKACSIAGTLYPEKPGVETAASYAVLAERRFTLLEKVLVRLYAELEKPDPGSGDTEHGTGKTAMAGNAWRERLLERLYMRGKPVRFIPGAAGSDAVVEGTLEGIGGDGELLIGVTGTIRSFITGELAVYENF
jgi:BirA family biotin operon repressor/biotin-[acetyl-CoA-carboxylase] ligase